MDVGTVPFGYGNPLYNNTGCYDRELAGRDLQRQHRARSGRFTAGIYDTIYQGKYGTLKAGVQYSYNQRFAFEGVGGAPKTDDNIVMTQIRYYPFNCRRPAMVNEGQAMDDVICITAAAHVVGRAGPGDDGSHVRHLRRRRADRAELPLVRLRRPFIASMVICSE